MDVIVIFNGLGNQMSQYAYFLQKRSLGKTYFISFCSDHNGMELDKVFSINVKPSLFQKNLYLLFRILLTNKGWGLNNIKNRISQFFNIRIVKENFDYNYKEQYLQPSRGLTYYYGGWHSELYFAECRHEIISKFKFNTPTDNVNQEIIKKISNTESVAVHVRRGDYLNASNINLFGGVCTQEYYEKAINFIEERVRDVHYFVFSNDIGWVKENLKLQNVTYIDNNRGTNSYIDMYLMSICKHNIIANSTFSWWGAWLNQNEDKIVICPNRFLNDDKSTDVYPQDWIKINNK
jgi:hypothetical protein